MRWISLGSGLLMTTMMAVTATLSVQAAVTLNDGTLVRSSSSPHVYLMDDGLKRWIESEAAFLSQGFRWSDVVVVSDSDLRAYAEGSPVTTQSLIVLPGEESVLPDLAPFAAQEVSLSTVNGRTLLRFTSTFWNMGDALFDLRAADALSDVTGDGYIDTFERITRPDGTYRDKLVGNFLWHDLHDHYHYDDFAAYTLDLVKPAEEGQGAIVEAATKKSTFCMRDDRVIALNADGSSPTRTFSVCGKYRQGVSVGWADVYSHTLPDQNIDVTGLPSGIYRLSFTVDPSHQFVEKNSENNTSVLFFELDVVRGIVKILASGSAFLTGENRYPNGTLVKTAGNPDIYVIVNNKKRLLSTEEVFLSYGYSWGNIYEVPSGVLAAIPTESFVKLTGLPGIYMINEAGYRRRILNPEVLSSYGVNSASVTEINGTEFASYRDTNFVALKGKIDVFALNERQYVGPLSSLEGQGIDPASVHVLNETDFRAYAISIAAKDLTVPWDIVFLPDGDMLVTERVGTIRRYGKNPGTITLPSVIHTGEGGLMGMALHPNFVSNNLLYLYFTTVDDTKENRVERFRLEGNTLIEDKTIIENIPAALYHDGGQIAFGPDGMLYITTGDAEVPDHAQDLSSLAGKTLRLTPDGGIPSDNPFGTAVWSYGHRNAQGIAWDAEGRMWETEHGRSGALSGYDELNLIQKGGNYGWPDSQGDTVQAGTIAPVRHSGATTTWAPSGIAYADGALFFAGLRGSSLYGVTVNESNAVTAFHGYLSDVYGRLRAVVLGPDGFLYVTTSNRDGRGTVRSGDDKILRIAPDFLRALP